VAVKIRLKRMGKIRAPFYRVVVMDSRTKRDGRAIEEIGKYHPTEEPSVIQIDSQRAQHWLRNGAQPTEAVAALLKVTGDWQTFRGESGSEGTLKVAETRRSKKEMYEAAVAAAGGASLEVKDAPARKRAEKAAAKAASPTAAPDASQGASQPAGGSTEADEETPVAPDTDSGEQSASGTPEVHPDPDPSTGGSDDGVGGQA
jgi:small subunit ribosomal protein S16